MQLFDILSCILDNSYIQCFAIGMNPLFNSSLVQSSARVIAATARMYFDHYASYITLTPDLVNRKSSQKPVDELYAAFKLAHPDVGPKLQPATSAAPTQSTVSATGALSDPIMDHRCGHVFLYFGMLD